MPPRGEASRLLPHCIGKAEPYRKGGGKPRILWALRPNSKRPLLPPFSCSCSYASSLSCPSHTSRHNRHSNLLPPRDSSRLLSFSCRMNRHNSHSNLSWSRGPYGSSRRLSSPGRKNRRHNNPHASKNALSHLSSQPNRDCSTPSRNTTRWFSFDRLGY